MALTRKMLKAMGIEEEKIDEIVDAHSETVDALKKERDKYKEDAEKLTDVQKKYDDLKKEVDAKEDDPYKEKYEKEHKAFEAFKKSIDAEKLNAQKATAYKNLLKEAKVSDNWIDDIVKFTSMDDIQLDEEGKIVDADKRIDGIKEKYAKYIVTDVKRGAGTENPPTNTSGNKMSKADIYKKDDHGRYVLSTAERQKALAESISGK